MFHFYLFFTSNSWLETEKFVHLFIHLYILLQKPGKNSGLMGPLGLRRLTLLSILTTYLVVYIEEMATQLS